MSETEETEDELDTLTGSQKTFKFTIAFQLNRRTNNPKSTTANISYLAFCKKNTFSYTIRELIATGLPLKFRNAGKRIQQHSPPKLSFNSKIMTEFSKTKCTQQSSNKTKNCKPNYILLQQCSFS